MNRPQLAASADLSLAVAVVAGLLVETAVRGHGAAEPGHLVLALAVGLCVAIRRRDPLLSLATTLALLLLVLPFMHATHVALAIAMVGAGTVAYQGRRRVSVLVALALVPVVVLAWVVAGGDGVGQEFFTYLVLVLAAVAAGDAIRSRQEATIARRDRELLARQAAARELFDEYRLQLGRDLHDSLAHSLVAITTRAGVAVHLGGGDDDLLGALCDVKRVSASALHELRTTLETLRADTAGAPTSPTLSSELTLRRLTQPLSMAGLVVRLRCDPGTERAPTAVSHAGYRIVQESLTNVLKHAAAGSVDVALSVEADMLHVEISNDGPVASPALPHDGHGLIGMRERAVEVGGTVAAGPRERGGWVVTARLPMSA